MAKNERDAKPTPPQFHNEFERGRKSALNGIETGVHKMFL